MPGKKGSPHGLPAKTLTDAQRIEVEALSAYLSTAQMADYFGIGRSTFFALMARDPDIAGRYKRGKSKAIGKVAQGLVQKAVAGDTTSSIFFLKTQGRWRETDRTAERERSEARAAARADLADIPLDELEAMVAAEKARRAK